MMGHHLATAAVAVLLLVACGETGMTIDAPPGDTAAWVHHGQVEGVLDGRAAAQAVTDAAAWADAWDRHGFDGPRPELDFDHRIVLLLGQADDACPDELVDLEVVDGRLEVVWLPPPGGCNQPLIMRIHAVEVHRGHVSERFTYGLDEPFTDELEPATIELPPYDGTAPPPPQPPQAMTDEEIDAVFAGHPVERCGPQHELRRTGEVDGPLSDDPEVAAAQQARAQFGVASDEATVRALLEDPPPAGVEDYGFPLTPEEFEQDRRATETAQRVAEWLQQEGYEERRVVPMIDRSEGIRAVVVVGADDEAALRDALADRFGDDTVEVRVSPWPPAEVAAAQDTLTERMGEIDPHAQVTFVSGPPGPAEIGLVDPTRAALDAIAAVVDPALVCVSVETSGVQPLTDRG